LYRQHDGFQRRAGVGYHVARAQADVCLRGAAVGVGQPLVDVHITKISVQHRNAYWHASQQGVYQP